MLILSLRSLASLASLSLVLHFLLVKNPAYGLNLQYEIK
jgi:hypothetical protein